MGCVGRSKELHEFDMPLDQYKKYRVKVLKDLYIRLNDEQMKHLDSLTRHIDVDYYLNDIILNSNQNDGPTVEEVVRKAYTKAKVNACKKRKAARENSRK